MMQNMRVEESEPSLEGVQADVAAGVTIGTVFNGYFNSSEAAAVFAEEGIGPLLPQLPTALYLADFGGGDGFLADAVCTYLKSNGKQPSGIVIDMNPFYLDRVRERGYKTLAASLEDAVTGPLDLAIARAILHYNSVPIQQQILANIHRNLKPGGYFVHSISSGDPVNCELRTRIAALPSLGRTSGEGVVHFITPEEYSEMAHAAGFADTTLVGYAPDNSWKLSDMFERFNPAPAVPDAAYEAHRASFMADALSVVESCRAVDGVEGVEILDEDARISYKYPIFVSRRTV